MRNSSLDLQHKLGVEGQYFRDCVSLSMETDEVTKLDLKSEFLQLLTQDDFITFSHLMCLNYCHRYPTASTPTSLPLTCRFPRNTGKPSHTTWHHILSRFPINLQTLPQIFHLSRFWSRSHKNNKLFSMRMQQTKHGQIHEDGDEEKKYCFNVLQWSSTSGICSDAYIFFSTVSCTPYAIKSSLDAPCPIFLLNFIFNYKLMKLHSKICLIYFYTYSTMKLWSANKNL